MLLQAGLEGIEHGYELPDPMEKNLYHLSPDERRRLGIEQLPETLGEAIELTAESELVLRTLGEHMFNRYIEIKRQEWDDYRVQVTPWELRALPAGAVKAGCMRPGPGGCSAAAGAHAHPTSRRRFELLGVVTGAWQTKCSHTYAAARPSTGLAVLQQRHAVGAAPPASTRCGR